MELDSKVLEQVLLCAEVFYIIDDETYELLYASGSMKLGSCNGKKCYEVLHNLSARCEQCPPTDLCRELQQTGIPYYRWERFDAQRNAWYQIRHRITTLEGRHCRIASCNMVEGMMQLGSEAIKEVGLLLNLLDENSKIKRQLEYDSTHDRMTGLYNRNRYIQDLEWLAEMASMGVAYLDINNLKETNDCYGHEQGDALICTVSQCIRTATQEDARCYRIGGDEFVVLFPNGTPDDLEHFHHTFFATLADKNCRLAHPCKVACGTAHSASPCLLDTLVSQAEGKMYKHKGKCSKLPH